MKIGPSYGPAKGTEPSGIKSDSARSARVSSPASSSDAKVQISDLAAKIGELQAALAQTDAFDVQKVDAIKTAISDGRFKVNPDQVAEKLLASVREMLEARG